MKLQSSGWGELYVTCEQVGNTELAVQTTGKKAKEKKGVIKARHTAMMVYLVNIHVCRLHISCNINKG
jgi:hypothetical protein